MKKTTLYLRFIAINCLIFITSTFSNQIYAQCTKGATTTISINKTYTNFTFPGDVIITNRAIVTISGTIKMKKDAKIVVSPGCTLNVNNALVTSFCQNDMWQGIEAHGTNWYIPSMQYLNCSWVNIENSTVEKAKIACLNTENSPSYLSKRGGWFTLKGSKFINNWIVLRADYQSAVSSQINHIINCSIEINNNTFVRPSQTTLKSLGFAFDFLYPFKEAMIDVKNTHLSIKKSNFKINISYNQTSTLTALGAISSTNSYLMVESSSFDNIGRTISHENIGQPLANSTFNNIQKNSFNIKDGTAISIKNTSWMTIGNNLINDKGNSGYFIELKNSPSPNVYNNSMISTFTSSGSFQNKIFLSIDNCSSMNADIRNNFFSSTSPTNTRAVMVHGSNGDNSNNPILAQGINFSCNNFRGGTLNNSGKSIELHPTGTIRKYQGRMFNNKMNATGNNIKEILSNSSNTMFYYYFGSPNTSNNQFPIVNGTVRNVSAPSSQCSPATGVDGGGSWVIPNIANPGGNNVLTSEALKEATDTREILNKELIKLKNEANTYLMIPENYEKLDEIYANASAVKAEKDNYTKLLFSNQIAKKNIDQSHSNEEIINLLYSFENTMGDIMVADYYFFENNPQQAQTVLEAIKTKYTLSPKEVREINDIKEFYTLLYPFVFEGRELDSLAENELTILKRMAGEESGMAKGRACSWLEVNNIKFCPDPIFSTNLEQNSIEENNTELYPMVALYPNPAIDYIDATIQTPIEYSQATLKIYTTMGEMKYNQSHQNCDFFRINVANWNRGFYHYTLEANGVVLKTGTISLITQ